MPARAPWSAWWTSHSAFAIRPHETAFAFQILPAAQREATGGRRHPVPVHASPHRRPRRPCGPAPLPEVHRHPSVRRGPEPEAKQPPAYPRRHQGRPRRREAHGQSDRRGLRYVCIHSAVPEHRLDSVNGLSHSLLTAAENLKGFHTVHTEKPLGLTLPHTDTIPALTDCSWTELLREFYLF